MKRFFVLFAAAALAAAGLGLGPAAQAQMQMDEKQPGAMDMPGMTNTPGEAMGQEGHAANPAPGGDSGPAAPEGAVDTGPGAPDMPGMMEMPEGTMDMPGMMEMPEGMMDHEGQEMAPASSGGSWSYFGRENPAPSALRWEMIPAEGSRGQRWLTPAPASTQERCRAVLGNAFAMADRETRAACGEDSGSDAGDSGEASVSVATAADGAEGKAAAIVHRTVEIVARDVEFDRRRVEVRPGETVRFVVTNEGAGDHEFVLGDAEEQREHEEEMSEMAEAMEEMPEMAASMMHDEPNAVALRPGETKEIVWTFDSPGEYQFACHVPGHYAAGMWGTILVLPDTASSQEG